MTRASNKLVERKTLLLNSPSDSTSVEEATTAIPAAASDRTLITTDATVSEPTVSESTVKPTAETAVPASKTKANPTAAIKAAPAASQASGPVSGSGSAGQIALWTSASTIGGDSSLVWDSANKRVGLSNSSLIQNVPQAMLHIFKAGDGIGQDRPTPSNISTDVLIVLERDQLPNPAGVAINMITGEDALIRYGSTNGDIGENDANVAAFDYDIRAGAFRFVPMLNPTDQRQPGRPFQNEAFSIYGGKVNAIDNNPARVTVGRKTRATSIATQSDSYDFAIEGSFWDSQLNRERRNGFIQRLSASTTATEVGRLTWIWSKDIGYDIGSPTYSELMSLNSSGILNIGKNGNVIQFDAVTDPSKPSIGTVAGGPQALVFKTNGITRGGIYSNGYAGFGNKLNFGNSTPLAPFHVFDSAGTVALFQRDGGISAARGSLSVIISDFDNGVGDVILDSNSGGDMALRSNGGLGGALRIKSTGDTVITGGKVGIGTINPSSTLTVAGTIESTSGGIKFPDGTTQTTASKALTSGSIQTSMLTDGIVTSAKIAAGAVGSAQLANSAVSSANIAPGQVVRSVNALTDNVTLAAGSNITITPSGNTLTIAASIPNTSWSIAGNGGTDPSANFLGTTDNTPLEIRVNNERALRAEAAFSATYGSSPNLIGGFSGNKASTGVQGAAIGGGGAINDANGNPAPNRVTDIFGMVGGGQGNQAGDNAGLTTDKPFATVGGGLRNAASGRSATIGGGHDNTASGDSAAIPGGAGNSAAGDYSFAAGFRAVIDPTHSGAVLFSDSHDFNFNSAAANEFAARATGGVRFVTAVDGTGNPLAGVQLAPGSGGWSSLSDRNVKTNFSLVDGRAILARLASIPIQYWSYKSQSAAIRHIGPTAQDFHTAFGMGEDDIHINMVDAEGVALSAIQGLYQLNLDKDKKIEQLTQEVNDLQMRLMRLEQAVMKK